MSDRSPREVLFSVSAGDCEWEYFRGSGAGGQKRNKTSSAVRVKHAPSGATGQAQDQRSQVQNKRIAFRRMADSPKFRGWVRIKTARVTGGHDAAMRYAQTEMDSDRVLVEVKEAGKWIQEPPMKVLL